MTQLSIAGNREHVSEPISLPRGDTKAIEAWIHDLQAAEILAVKFTVRNEAAVAVVELTSDAHSAQFDYSTDYKIDITLNAVDTVGLPLAAYKYGIEITDNSNRIYTPFTGIFSLIADVVYDDSASAAYLSRTTLDEYEDAMDSALACVNGTRTTAAASSGASAVVVTAPGIFLVTDDIVVALDDGTREKHAIDTIVSYTLNLDGTTLGDDVAQGNVVMKVG